MNQYQVNFHYVTSALGVNNPPSSLTIDYAAKATAPAAPQVEGWTMDGWYTDQACTQSYNFNTPITSNMTLYAKW